MNPVKPLNCRERAWVRLYTEELVSTGEIADRAGESRQRINYALKKAGVKMRKRSDYSTVNYIEKKEA